MPERRRPKPALTAISEVELAAVSASLFARPGLWRDLALPPDARGQATRSPWCAYWSVRLGPLSDPAADREVLAAACSAFEARADRLGTLLACAAAIETYYFDETELEPMDAWIARLDRAIGSTDPPWPNTECGAEVMACGSAIRLRQPSYPHLAEWAAAGPRLLTRISHVPSRIKFAAFVAHYHLWRGEFAGCALVFDTLPGIDVSMLRPTEALIWLEGLAAFARFTAQFERGREAVREALALIGAHGLDAEIYGVNALGAALALAAHDAPSATRHLEAMRATLATRPQSDQTGYWHLSAGLALLEGRTRAALALARSTLEQSESVGGPYRSVAHRLSLACILLVQGDTALAAREAQATLAGAQAIDATLTVFSAGLLASHATERQGQRDEADRLLAQALALGAARDYALTGGWWLPEMVAERMARALVAGIEPAYARRFARRAALRCSDPTLEAWPWPLAMRGFGEFGVWLHGEPLVASGARVPQRPLDLLRALLAHGAATLPVATALEWLWPDAEYDAQRKAFDAALLRLRRTLGDDSLLVLDAGQLVLDRQRCWSDVAALAATSALTPGEDDQALLARAERLLQLVRGPFLDGLDTPWAMAARERSRKRFVLTLVPIAERLEAHAPHDACRLYERALQADPLAESLARRLIAALLACGERAEALRAWHQCKTMLRLHGAAPSRDTLALVRQADFAV